MPDCAGGKDRDRKQGDIACDSPARSALSPGAASGIGKAIAARFLSEGAKVALFDRDEKSLSRVSEEFDQNRSDILTAVGSVDDAAAVNSTIKAVIGRWSRIDSLVTAAALSVGGIATETSEETWDDVISVNVKGTLPVVQGRPPLVHRSKAGLHHNCRVATGTHRWTRAMLHMLPPRGAVISLTRSLALDYAAMGVRANALVPAAVENAAPAPLVRAPGRSGIDGEPLDRTTSDGPFRQGVRGRRRSGLPGIR